MNNKLFTFLDPLLGYIDNGRFFREPFRWLYVIFAVLNLLFPIFILAKVIEMDFFKYAEGKLILAFILLFIILCAGAWGSYLLWMNRKNKLKEAIQEENEFIAIPVVSHLTQTMGEWLGLYIGVIGTLCSVVIAIFAANEIRYILPIPSGMFFLMPIYGFLIVVFARPEQEKIDDLMGAIAAEFPEITSLLYVVNQKVNDTIADQEVITYRGRDYINEEMEGLQFRIGPKSFYQTNSLQAYELYKVARRMACLKPDDLVYDLYTGTGTIANFVARQVKKVVGNEYVPEAIADARLNSEVNGIDNTIFFAGDMKDVLTDGFIAEHGRPDVMIIDPPRAGMHEDVVNVILNARPERIVYVSCNPATQARDLALMDSLYRVEEVQPVDMFPHTHHVENVVRMTRR